MNFIFLRAARNKLPAAPMVRSFGNFFKKIGQVPGQGQAPSRFPIFLYKQDQLTLEGRTAMTYTSEEVFSGLENKYCRIHQNELAILLEEVPATLADFIKMDQDKKDALHTFGVATLCFTMFNRDIEFLRRSGLLKNNVIENWNKREQVKLYPRFEHGRNASYNPQDKTMKFNFFRPSPKEDYLYLCRSFDYVAHESGHAVLDTLRPDYYLNKDAYPEIAPLHEAFGDLTYLFLVLDQAILRHHLINETISDLTKHSFFSNFGEEFGIKTKSRLNCARQALNDAKMGEGNPDPHHQSQALTGAVYELIAEYFAWLKGTCPFYSDEENLSRTGRDLRILFLRAVIEIPDSAVTCKRVGLQMLEIADQHESQEVKDFLKSTISRIFASRGIIPPESIDSLGLKPKLEPTSSKM